MLAKSFTFKKLLAKIEGGGFDENKLEKSSIEKTPVFKKNKFGYSVLGLRKPNFKTKIIHFEISHNAENCKRGPLRFFNNHSVAKFKKNEGEPIGVFEKFSKKKTKNDSAEKSERDPLKFFNIRSVAKYQNKLKGGPFENIKKFSKKKSHKAEKREESDSAEKVRTFCFGILVKN